MTIAPISERALGSYDEYAEAVRSRLLQGCKTYGDSSFTRPLEEVVQELMTEALDMAGWGFILYRRLKEIERAIAAGKNTERLVRMNETDWTIEHAMQVHSASSAND